MDKSPNVFIAPDMPIDEAVEPEIDYEGLGDNYPLHINMLAGSLAGITVHVRFGKASLLSSWVQVQRTLSTSEHTSSLKTSQVVISSVFSSGVPRLRAPLLQLSPMHL